MRRSILAGLSLCLACAGTPDPAAPSDDSGFGGAFESRPELRASDLIPLALRHGPHHDVREIVRTDGLLRIYDVDSEFGVFRAEGDERLRDLVHEIRALSVLAETSRTVEFATAMAKGLRSPFVATWNLIRHPVDSITGLPREAFELVRRTSDLARNERSELEESALKEFIGFEAKKRELAHRLGVDAYTSNAALQRELNRFGWVAYAGGLPFLWVPFVGEEAPAPGSIEPEERLAELLRLYSPEDLRRFNRIELAVMGVPEERAREFLRHPWYSPLRQTKLVAALTTLDLSAERVRLIEAALAAGDEQAAWRWQREAELLAGYAESGGAIDSLVVVKGVPAGRTPAGDIVSPLVADHALWAGPLAARARVLAGLGTSGSSGPLILVSGTVSERARSEMQKLGLRLNEEVR